jgi:hypothetical protein
MPISFSDLQCGADVADNLRATCARYDREETRVHFSFGISVSM